MKALMNMDSKLVRTMTRLGDIMLLNAMLMLCSLPVFTCGAALSAVYDMTLRILRDQDEGTIKGFFRAFRKNFKQATQIWLLFLAVIGVSVGDLLAARLPQLAALQLPLRIAAGVQLFLLLALGQYVFALIARFENTSLGTLKNSSFLILAHLPETLAMMLISLSAPLIFLFVPPPEKIFPCFVTLGLLVWFGGEIFLNTMFLRRIFQMRFGTEETEKQREERIARENLQAMKMLF